MILSGSEIVRQVNCKQIVISPFDRGRVNPNSYNVRLAPELKLYSVGPGGNPKADQTSNQPLLDAKVPPKETTITIPNNGLILRPGYLYLGKTVEYTETPFHVPMLEGRSSMARLGICVHVTAGFGDRGFKGHWTLELFCVHPVRIYPNMEVAQLCYYDVDQGGPVYEGKYNNEEGSEPGASQIYKDLVESPESPSKTS